MEFIHNWSFSSSEPHHGHVAISGVILVQVTSLTKDHDYVITISGREKMQLSIVLFTLVLNLGMRSGSSKIYYTRCSSFTKLKFTKYEKIIHCLYWGFSWDQKKYLLNAITLSPDFMILV
jgi:hypothetical protein